MSVAAWLASLGLEQYAEAFAAHGVDADVLPLLRAEDLRELGVAAIGHRRKLLDALAVLRTSAPRVPPAPAERPLCLGERRQLTVMFVDLIGFTALSVRLDPEELREVLQAYQDAMAREITRFGGLVSRFLGDGVLAHFGFPTAHEEDAERAVCAGLAIVAAAAALRTPADLPLCVRVGIATGLVVVGDLIGSGPAREQAAIGETPNLAARLQALAEPGTVVIADCTRQLIGGLFDCVDLGCREIPGFIQPLRAWRVLGHSRIEGRFEARQVGGLMPLVGRERELGRLLELWRLACDAAGQVALLVGEPGIGKSRLVKALVDQLQPESHVRLHCHCSPLHASTPLHPAIDQIERAVGAAHDDSADRKLDRLEALLAQATDDVTEIAPLFAALLSIPAAGRYPALEFAPQAQRERTLAALLGQVEGLARRKPVLLVFEDAHWSDPTTLDLLDLIVHRLRTLPVLMIVTFRPEFTSPWSGSAHVTSLPIDRLDAAEARAVVEQLRRAKPLSADAIDEVVAKADGVPLFLEELTKTVLEASLVEPGNGRERRSGRPPAVAIPASLQDSLVARLDRLAPVREVAQTAACLGREFDRALLAAVLPLPEPKLVAALDLLVTAELLYRIGARPEDRYSFKHSLVRDAAYATLLNSRRQQLHARIVTVLEDQFPERARTQPQILAQHCAEAGLIAQAIEYRHQAGLSAAQRSALKEAITELQRGLDLIPLLPDSLDRTTRELELQVALGATLLAAKGEAAPEIGRAYQRARDLYRRAGDADLEPAVLWGLWHYHMNRAELALAREVATDHLRAASGRGSVVGQALGHRCLLVTDLFAGELEAALRHREQICALVPPAQGCPPEILLDPWITSLSLAAWAVLLRGDREGAVACSQEATAAARRQGRPYMLAVVLHHQNVFNQLIGDRQQVEDGTAESLALTKERGFAHWHATATLLHGWSLGHRGALAAGIELMQAGLVAKKATCSRLKLPYYQALLAKLLGRAGRVAEALPLLEDGFAQVAATGEHWFTAEMHRIHGELLLGSAARHLDQAVDCFTSAADLARRQGATWWEARAARSLASIARAA